MTSIIEGGGKSSDSEDCPTHETTWGGEIYRQVTGNESSTAVPNSDCENSD